MGNIVFKGFFQGEDQLRRTTQDGMVLDEPDDINAFLRQGTCKSLVIVLAVVIMAVWTIRDILHQANYNHKDIVLALVLSGLIVLVCQYVHEIIHTLFYPRKAIKEIYIMKDLSCLFVYCTTPIKKNRFITMAMAPNAILGIVPLCIGVLGREQFTPMLAVILIVSGAALTVSGIGDYYNIYNVMRQVPENAYVFNNGLHTYWRGSSVGENRNSAESDKVWLILVCALGAVLLFFQQEASMVAFLFTIIIATLHHERFYRVFRWCGLGILIVACFLL